MTHEEFAQVLARNPQLRINSNMSIEKRAQPHNPKTDYKAQLVRDCELIGLKLEPEFKFDPSRKFRADWRVHYAMWEGKDTPRPKNPSWCASNVLVEYEGGLFSTGKRGHSSVSGILRDCEKSNLAQILGYIVIRVAPNHVISGEALTWIEQALRKQTG